MKNRALVAGHPKVDSIVTAAVAALLVVVLVLAASGCSSEESGDTATTASGTSVGPSAGTGPAATANSTTTLPEVLSDWDRELAETAQVQNRLAAYLAEQGVAGDDPRMAVIFGLRARTQAITGRQALDQGDLGLADMAMKDVYPTLNLGRNLAEGTVSKILEDAYATIATLGTPSDKPEEAAASLDEFIATLRALLNEAEALVPST